MTPNITVDLLGIEVTRRCNMSCPHCIRGDAQNLDISDAVLEAIARNVQPYNVVFSGGEPSLNVPAITRYFELAEKYHHLPDSFYVVTNGKANQEELAVALLRAYGKMEDRETCGVSVSRDIFHDPDTPGASIFKGLSFYRKDHVHPLTERDPQWVINTGRAAQNNIGRSTGYEISSAFEDFVEFSFPDGFFIPDMLYVGVNGMIADICDISYAQLDSSPLGTIFDLPKKAEELLRKEEIA